MKPSDLAALAALAWEDGEMWEAEELLNAALQLATKSPTPALERFRHAVRMLPLPALQRLEQRLTEERRAKAEKDRAARPQRRPGAVAERAREGGGWTLRQEHVLCGKDGCTKQHGPYWYGYRTVAGRTKKRYFGKKKPTAAELAEAIVGKANAGDLAHGQPKKKTRTGRNLSR